MKYPYTCTLGSYCQFITIQMHPQKHTHKHMTHLESANIAKCFTKIHFPCVRPDASGRIAMRVCVGDRCGVTGWVDWPMSSSRLWHWHHTHIQHAQPDYGRLCVSSGRIRHRTKKPHNETWHCCRGEGGAWAWSGTAHQHTVTLS